MSELWRLKRGGPFCSGIRQRIFSIIMGIIELIQDSWVGVAYKFLEEVPGEFCNKFIYSLNLQIVVDDTVSNVPGSIGYDSKDFVLENLCFFTVGKCCDAQICAAYVRIGLRTCLKSSNLFSSVRGDLLPISGMRK
ncbi:hypothetical protein AVEN_168345-1 [Araneus ventricosus]|uniref:Uncharacterized protein n=1 Tax=Araneus ventricosus TaxID=182803 RepID=A0A4Y2M8E2_ARAVE|nr:hypothetical protein AVEN_168345-1 [Araneus ventricosus]